MVQISRNYTPSCVLFVTQIFLMNSSVKNEFYFIHRKFVVLPPVKKDSLISILFLLIALMIYLIWRSESIVLNHLVGSIFSNNDFNDWRETISTRLPLNDLIIYSLPGGLWVFVSTVAFKDFYVLLKKLTFNLMFLPITISVVIELSQLLHLSNGTFDGWDILISLVFWVAALIICPPTEIKEEFFKSEQTSKKIWAIISLLILSLAHQI